MVRFDPLALEEIATAIQYFGSRDAELAVRFSQALDEAVAEIAAGPQRWPQTVAGCRRHRVGGFPYAVVYAVESEALVVVYAIAHLRRDPAYWVERLG